ncbi:MAG: hypothetical protein AAB110_09005 [Candidatus Desantisbacteria bacterium]
MFIKAMKITIGIVMGIAVASIILIGGCAGCIGCLSAVGSNIAKHAAGSNTNASEVITATDKAAADKYAEKHKK